MFGELAQGRSPLKKAADLQVALHTLMSMLYVRIRGDRPELREAYYFVYWQEKDSRIWHVDHACPKMLATPPGGIGPWVFENPDEFPPDGEPCEICVVNGRKDMKKNV